jgi:pimeloyl-ACP methyl ester carboxylesterase
VLWVVLLLLVLISLPAISWLILWRNRRRIPPPYRFIEAEGVRLHYYEAGQGKPVVFIHGSNGSLHDYKLSLLDEAAKEFHVIAFDRPGHGHSERQKGKQESCAVHGRLIMEAWQKMGIKRPIVVGHSSAGAVVMDLALRNPEEMAAIVLIDGVVHSEGLDSVPILPLYRLLTRKKLGKFLCYMAIIPLMSAISGKMLKFLFSPDPVPSSYRRLGIALALRPECMRCEGEDLICLGPTLAAIENDYAQMKVPLVVVFGEEDKVVPPGSNSIRLAEEVPGAELIRLPGAGHLPMFSKALDVIAAIHRASQLSDAKD